MKYKILCTDIDGTLLTSKNDVSNFTVREFSRIKGRLKIILVSARMPNAMNYLQKKLGLEKEPIVCYNGALILDGTTRIFSTTIPIRIVKSINHSAIKYEIKIGIYYNDEWYTSEKTDTIQKEIHCTRVTPIFETTKDTIDNLKRRGVGAHKLMLMGKKEALDFINSELQREFNIDLIMYRSNDTLLEVAPKHTSKLLGIQKLLKHDETLDEIIAFGDNYNDIEMLKGVGYGVAVANAREEVKDIANKITLSNTDDGVAHFVRNNIFI